MSKPTRASIIIREGRKRAGLTQQELADKLGITTGACLVQILLPAADGGKIRICAFFAPA